MIFLFCVLEFLPLTLLNIKKILIQLYMSFIGIYSIRNTVYEYTVYEHQECHGIQKIKN
uniref:Uncharacterized protein n=1 Tax=Meloidogyne enterolobii TaxID=390850 RepID=A0A6V7TT05_MELEN|nr:unnamed protein product [Meloidogyne enterolobii]